MNIQFRPIDHDEDRPFLFSVYASTRSEELALTGWDDRQKAAFLEMQFEAQCCHYQEYYRDSDFLIILLEDLAVGRLYVARRPTEIAIVDIALLPGYRRLGIGTQILQSLLAEAAAKMKPVRIHVERFNAAQNLYRRLGFLPIEEHGMYLLMEHLADRMPNL
ncbi:MAG: GNAT family N-acetyltransferase [Gammaproteobacteria bacterium]